jgi:hypothetical protein
MISLLNKIKFKFRHKIKRYVLDFFRNSLSSKKFVVFERIYRKLLKSYTSIWPKNLLMKMTKTTVLATKWNFKRNLFIKMVAPTALEKARPYLDEERVVLQNFLKTHANVQSMNFCVVGGGGVHYLALASKYTKKYIIIEPYLSDYLPHDLFKKELSKQNTPILHQKFFEDYCSSNSEIQSTTPSIYVFWFNVISYIDQAIHNINKIAKKGDVIFISGWRNTHEAQTVMTDYFDHVKGHQIFSRKIKLPSLNKINCTQISEASSIELKRGKITDIQIIYL